LAHLLRLTLCPSSPQVTPDSSRVIDPEFAFMGPLAFDPAKIIGELIIPFFASDGHEAAAGGDGAGSRAGQRTWLLEAIVEVWDTFSTQ
jgi:5-methylthioribose kinase